MTAGCTKGLARAAVPFRGLRRSLTSSTARTAKLTRGDCAISIRALCILTSDRCSNAGHVQVAQRLHLQAFCTGRVASNLKGGSRGPVSFLSLHPMHEHATDCERYRRQDTGSELGMITTALSARVDVSSSTVTPIAVWI